MKSKKSSQAITVEKARITQENREWVYILILLINTFLKINKMTTPKLVSRYLAIINGRGPYSRKKAITGFNSDDPRSIRIRVNNASKMLSIKIAVMAEKIR